jgi:hypothetical protein
VRLPMIAQGAMAFNSLRSPNVYPYSVPQILVTLILSHRFCVIPVKLQNSVVY